MRMDEMSAPGHVKFTPPARGSIYGFAVLRQLDIESVSLRVP
jgi:hypothetical protein